MPEQLSTKQQDTLDAIINYQREHGMPPTQRELQDILGLGARRAVQKRIQTLVDKGWIKIKADVARGIEVLSGLGLPVVGQIAAGAPVLANDHIEYYLNIPTDMFNRPPDFLLRVVGDSMKNVGILDGDLVGIRKQHAANLGEIIAARIDDDVTLKYLEQEDGKPVLMPANEAYLPIRPNPEALVVEGIYVGLIRQTENVPQILTHKSRLLPTQKNQTN